MYVRPNPIFFFNFLIFDIATGQHLSARSVNQNRLIICWDKCILARKCKSECQTFSVCTALGLCYAADFMFGGQRFGHCSVSCYETNLLKSLSNYSFLLRKVCGGLKAPLPGCKGSLEFRPQTQHPELEWIVAVAKFFTTFKIAHPSSSYTERPWSTRIPLRVSVA